MNFKVNETAEKLRGGYYTKPEIASFLLKWVLEKRPKTILEPSCGDGVFFSALANLNHESVGDIIGFEIDEQEAAKASKIILNTTALSRIIYAKDFLGWSLEQKFNPRFDAVVGNPPYIRYQYLDRELQSISEQIFKEFHLRFTKHTNAWVPFVVASLALTKPGGRLAMVLPSELLHVIHAQSLRSYIVSECSKVLIIDPQELWFDDALQGVVLVLAEKKRLCQEKSFGVGIVGVKNQSFLIESPKKCFDDVNYSNGETITGKWMRALLTNREQQLFRDIENRPNIKRLGEIANTDVGIVTGANDYFLVTDELVDEYNLHKWAHPMFGRSEHIPGVIYDKKIHLANRKAGLPTNFIWLKDISNEDLSSKLKSYIQKGELNKLNERYKCRIRSPWYCVPSVYSSEIGMLKRCHNFPRLFLNKMDAYTTDTAYRIKIKQSEPSNLVYSFVNSLTALSAELEGRHYGGGVLELVPSEIEKLLIPLVDDRGKIEQLDKDIRMRTDAEALLLKQNRDILVKHSISKSESEIIHQAWLKLRARRQRRDY
ncbi:MAG: SAM-dependent methyltransferase [Actinobacteria bacterium]|nr:MAG: SAM-dependent methyltransferase [Actinomycetota bacterium]